MTRASSHPRLEIVEQLRGLAALAVAWFHFTQANTAFPTTSWLRASGTYGWLGVESFFVISGFIIPYAMFRAGYRIANWRTFLVKRLLRLEPPYIAAIVVTLVLWWISSRSPGFTNASPSPMQVLLHIGYAPALFGYRWLDTSYWTLAIEFQYYVLMAVSFAGIAHSSRRLRYTCFAIACALPFVFPSELFLVRYLPVFALGVATFWTRTGLVSRAAYAACLAAAAGATVMIFGPLVAGVGVATALLIAYASGFAWRPLTSLGALSYSLYLLHGPIGERVVNLGARYAHTPMAEVLVMLAALAVSLAAAFVLYRFVELPALRIASSLRYRTAAESTRR